MAVRNYGVNDPETAKAWAAMTWAETIRKTYFYALMGASPDNVICRKDDLARGPGDRVTVTLIRSLTQAGIQGDGQVENFEESVQSFTDNVFIDALDFAVRMKNKGTIDQQRVPFNLREDARDLLSEHWAERLDIGLFNQLAGNTAQSDSRYTGLNSVTAPSSGRHFWADDTDPPANTADEDLVAADVMTMKVIDRAVARAEVKTTTGGAPRIRPTRIRNLKSGGYWNGAKYVLFAHPWQIHNLRQDAATAGNWFDIERARVEGGDVTENPIFTGGNAVGIHNGVLIMKCESIPEGVNSSTGATVSDTRRAVLCGAQAAMCAFGQGNQNGRIAWEEDLFNYRKELGVDSHMLFGLKKAVFDSHDFGSIVISTYAAAP